MPSLLSRSLLLLSRSLLPRLMHSSAHAKSPRVAVLYLCRVEQKRARERERESPTAVCSANTVECDRIYKYLFVKRVSTGGTATGLPARSATMPFSCDQLQDRQERGGRRAVEREREKVCVCARARACVRAYGVHVHNRTHESCACACARARVRARQSDGCASSRHSVTAAPDSRGKLKPEP
jgi:hypothetical protein